MSTAALFEARPELAPAPSCPRSISRSAGVNRTPAVKSLVRVDYWPISEVGEPDEHQGIARRLAKPQ